LREFTQTHRRFTFKRAKKFRRFTLKRAKKGALLICILKVTGHSTLPFILGVHKREWNIVDYTD
jgi:hypothetical protein